MSRTFRRKNLKKPGELKALGYLHSENKKVVCWRWAVYSSERVGMLEWEDDGYSSYQEYYDEKVRSFHSDKTFSYVNYSSAPRYYNNVREREFRRKCKNEIKLFMKDQVEDVFIFNKPVDSAWDYW